MEITRVGVHQGHNTTAVFSDGIRVGSLVFLGGRVAPRSSPALQGPVRDEAEVIFDDIERLLGELGASLEHIVKVVTYLTSLDYRPEVYDVIGRRLGDTAPVSTGLIISSLNTPEGRVEIDVTAVVPD